MYFLGIFFEIFRLDSRPFLFAGKRFEFLTGFNPYRSLAVLFVEAVSENRNKDRLFRTKRSGKEEFVLDLRYFVENW